MRCQVFAVFLIVFGLTQAALDPNVEKLAEDLQAFSDTCANLSVAIKKMDFTAKGFTNYALSSLEDFNNRFLNFMETLKPDASDLGKVVINCFETENKTVTSDLTVLTDELGKCMGGDMVGLKWYMDQYIEGLDWLVENFNKYAADMKACDRLLVVCIDTVMEKNHLDILTIVGFLGGRIFEIVTGVAGAIKLALDLKDCASTSLNTHIETWGRLVFKETVSCIEQNWKN